MYLQKRIALCHCEPNGRRRGNPDKKTNKVSFMKEKNRADRKNESWVERFI
jgi:hypothetical protein